MRNQPKFIYLQTGLEDCGETCSDFDELDMVSWCVDKIYSDDLQYISVSSVFARIKELEKDVYIDPNDKKQRVKELKNLIK